MTNAVLFGIGIVTVLNVPSLAAHAWIGLSVVVVLSLLLAVRIAWRRKQEADTKRIFTRLRATRFNG
jgi:hypothetical protein